MSALFGLDRFATEPFAIFLESTAISMGNLRPNAEQTDRQREAPQVKTPEPPKI